MAAGVTDRLWSLEDLCEELLAEPEGEKPETKPLALRTPETTARELPCGRGWLRVVGGGKGTAPATPSPPPAPEPTPVAVVDPMPVAPALASDDRQLDLFAWKPRPRKPAQLNLFGEPEEGT